MSFPRLLESCVAMSVFLLAVGCGGQAPTGVDAGAVDAGVSGSGVSDGGPADAGASADAGTGFASLALFSKLATLEADGGQTPYEGADDLEFLDGGLYRRASRTCTGAGFGGGSWQLGDAGGLFIPDDKPGKPGTQVRFEADGGLWVLDPLGEVTLWQRGGRCLSGCDGGQALVVPCDNPW